MVNSIRSVVGRTASISFTWKAKISANPLKAVLIKWVADVCFGVEEEAQLAERYVCFLGEAALFENECSARFTRKSSPEHYVCSISAAEVVYPFVQFRFGLEAASFHALHFQSTSP